MFWPSPVDSECDLEVLDTPRHFAVNDSKDMLVFLHCEEEAEAEMCACPDPAAVQVTLAPLDTPATDAVVTRTRLFRFEVNTDLSITEMWRHSDSR